MFRFLLLENFFQILSKLTKKNPSRNKKAQTAKKILRGKIFEEKNERKNTAKKISFKKKVLKRS